MRISLRWLSDYVAVPGDPVELSNRLTLAGFEVEKIDRPGESLKGVVVAQVIESAPHPNAEKLSVVRVEMGNSTSLQIVCGAKNYRVGDKVPLAVLGTRLPNGVEIREANLRGVSSSGMLCSAKELGISDDAEGLLLLDPAASVGAPLAQTLGLDDAILEIDVTPNRPDALCHLGIAREVSALTGSPLKFPEVMLAEAKSSTAEKIRVRIDDSARCPRYGARVVESVAIGPSPSWLSARLKACGVRSINNVVDVTNYVLLEYGQPLHAFDLDKVREAEIIVRLARTGERLITLDGKDRTLDPDDLLICDAQGALALAGVMGGGDSEVSASTTRVLLEGANFQPASIRRTSKRHALHTEASHRFERGVDIEAVPASLDRAAALIAQLSNGHALNGMVDAYPNPSPPHRVNLRYARVSQLLGAPVEAEQSRSILSSLGFQSDTDRASSALYTVPSFRVDVEREEDLIEEVARIRGYDAIPNAFPRGLSELSPESFQAQAEARIRIALTGEGFYEVINYSFVSPIQQGVLSAQPPISLLNPLSVEQSVMRTTLYGGLLQNVAQNLRHQAETIRIYEVGRIYLGDPRGGVDQRPVAEERLKIAGTLWGRRDARTWTSPNSFIDFFDAKGAIEAILAVLGLNRATFHPVSDECLHPRASASVHLPSEAAPIGTVGELHPSVAAKLGLPRSIFVFELDAEALIQNAVLVPQYKAPARHPAVLRDLAVVVPLSLSDREVREIIIEVGAPLVDEALIFDVYTGKPIPEGRKNLAYALRYRAPDRTLTDAEVNEIHNRIVEQVQVRLGAHLRGTNP